MDQDDRRRFQERQQRAGKKHKTLQEQKRIKEEARKRRAERRKPPRARWRPGGDPDDGESAPCERRRSRAGAPDPAVGPALVDSEPTDAVLECASVVSVARTRVGLETEHELLTAVSPPGLELAVGDRVGFERRAAGLVLVRSRAPRTSWLARPDPGRTGGRLVLAANVERVLCVVAAAQPRWKPGFVDRVLLAAEEGQAEGVIVLNKLDLLASEERAALTAELEPFAAFGATVLCVSAANGEGLAELAAATAGRMCVFVGPSGVGKSSLLNALDPELGRLTGAVRASDGKGRHTTTASELVTLANGARLIDTPGVRQFGLAGLDRRTLASYFPELAALAPHCRFRDCAHLAEPDCAVHAALTEGRLAPRRYAAYRRIHATLDEP